MLLDNVRALHGLVVVLPVHYWMRWTQLLHGSGSGLITGFAAQAGTVAVTLTLAHLILSRRDPAA